MPFQSPPTARCLTASSSPSPACVCVSEREEVYECLLKSVCMYEQELVVTVVVGVCFYVDSKELVRSLPRCLLDKL